MEFGALLSSAVVFSSSLSLSLLSLGPPRPPPPPPAYPKLNGASLFSKLKKKKKLTGALNLRAGGLWRGELGAGTAASAVSYLVKFVLPSAWTKAPGAAGEDTGLARRLCLAPARSAPLAPSPPPPSRARFGPPTPTTASFQYGILSVRMPGTLF